MRESDRQDGSAAPYSAMLRLGARKGSTPREDFITEALAAAVNRDPRPLIRTLRTQPNIRKLVTGVKRFRARTQVPLKRAGRLDLVLESQSGVQIWIEVKAWSGEHGNQLQNYERAARAQRPRPRLMMLATAGAVPSIKIPKFSWGSLIKSIEACKEPSDLWLELRSLLIDEGLGSSLNWPLTVKEAASLTMKNPKNPATVRAMDRFVSFANELEGMLSWKEPNRWFANLDKRLMVTNQVSELGRVVYQFETAKRITRSIKQDPFLFTWIGFDSGQLVFGIEGRAKVNLRHELGSVFDIFLQSGWTMEAKNILTKSSTRLAFAHEDQAVQWALTVFALLRSSGCLQIMCTANDKHGVGYYGVP